MQEVTMTVHEALCEIKTNIKRIENNTLSTSFCLSNKQSATKVNGQDKETYMAETKATYQSTLDLIRRTEAMKAAIYKSNAETIVTVKDRTMTVAEAIYYLSHGIDTKETLLNNLVTQYKVELNRIENENGDKLENRVQRFVADTFGTRDKVSTGDIESFIETYRKSNSYVLIDPIGIADEIKRLKDEIDEFRTSVDSALQVSNANTTITFSY